MEEPQIKEALITLLDGITRADSVVITREMEVLDGALTCGGSKLHPQLEHFLQRRSYAKALAFLGGASVPASTQCSSRRVS